MRDAQGRPVKVLTDSANPIDQTLIQTLAAYPHYSVNGEDVISNKDGKQVFVPSVLVMIPHHTPSIIDPGASNGATGSSPIDSSQQQQPVPGEGQLRSIDSQR
jgi:hypothetical protein